MNVDIVRGLWFKSFENFDEELYRQLEIAHLNAYESAFPISVLYMAWMGMDYDEMAAVRKDEIDRLNNLNDKIKSFLTAYASMPVHALDARFPDAPLLRSREMPESNYDAISARISRFNKALGVGKPIFVPSCIRECGIFCRIVERDVFLPKYGKNRPVTERMWKVYESAFERKFSGVRQITNTMKRFEEWKKLFGYDQ